VVPVAHEELVVALRGDLVVVFRGVAVCRAREVLAVEVHGQRHDQLVAGGRHPECAYVEG
jgi:hypothetical protein